MNVKRNIRTIVAVVLLGLLGFAANASAADAPTHVIPANVNDAGIDPGPRHVNSRVALP